MLSHPSYHTQTSTRTHNSKTVFGPSSQISISFHSRVQITPSEIPVKIAMIGLIMLPTVSKDGNEFGI